MRLTLRTLLAYMDDILDPADHEELGRKIEASPFATELIHRSRDAVRRLRLSAPEPISGDGGDLHDGDPNLDANTAAEYLDNTLSPDDVAEFERACLEAGPNADMLLAEAASCHHILTLVLGEPAEVDADLRQRMYTLIAHAGDQRAAAAPATPVAPAAAVPVATVPASTAAVATAAAVAPEGPRARSLVDPDESSVPDYMLEALRAHRRKQRQLIAMMLVAAMLGGAAAFLFWPQPEPTVPKEVAAVGVSDPNKLSDLEVASPTATTGAATADVPGSAASTGVGDPELGGPAPAFTPGPATAPVVAPGAPTAAGDAASPPAPADAAPAPGSLGDELGISGPAEDRAMPPPGGVVDPAMPDATTGDLIAGTATTVQPPAGTSDATPPTGVTVGGATLTSPPVLGPDLGGGAAPPPSATPTDAAGPPPPAEGPTPPVESGAALPDAGAPVPPPETEAPAARQVGAYLGLNNDVLLNFDPASNSWGRLPARSTFTGGARLMVLPAFRTMVVLGGNADINAFFGGGTEAVLRAPIDGSDVALDLPYGHVILNAGPSGNSITLAMGDVVRVVKLGKSASLAIGVKRLFIPGSNPAKEPAPIEIDWFLTTGTAEWSDGSAVGSAGAMQSAQGPAAWITVAGVDQPPQTIDELPPWIDKEPILPIDAGARDVIAEALVAGQAVGPPLLELTGTTGLGRRTEVRTLAAMSAAFIGEFEPLIKALADPNERARRDERIIALRDAVARNPDSVNHIHDAFALQLGEQAADDLTEMVLGFDPDSIGTSRDQVKNGSLLRLINWLDDDDLTYRVLASFNLNEITGTQYLGGYRPEHAAAKRKREIAIYADRLEKGELLPTEWTPAGWAKR